MTNVVTRGVSWDALRVFVAVYRVGSITGAADELGMAQASVSGQVAGLERRLGYPLFERSHAGVTATNRGRELAAGLAEPIDRLHAATAASLGTGDARVRTLFLGGPAEFLSEVVLPGLADRLPTDVRLNVTFGMADELLAGLSSGALDAVVSSVRPHQAGVSFAPICDEEFVLVGHPRWRGHDIDTIPVLTYGTEFPIIRRYWRGVFGRPPTGLRVATVAPDLRALLRLAVAGHGMTVLPNYLTGAHLHTGELVSLHQPHVAPLNTLYVATRRSDTARSPETDALRTAVAEVARRRAD
ncbi:LysR family transcriptional regulator [Spiractinospora alimapuensis]|uniref:LysR family transcriptional regulator n=1 Tax=Spiractinospora alimapuensis TaxID=2820884 RepID=UPI001F28498F|nr:LysR family transcriptional regulator [Spiractinospora alimapuensis]QVQ51532.1 LysR family transcriptional regulator [Spiractinospora alimapuensis]